MAIDESVFADYNAAIAPTQDFGIAGFQSPQQALQAPQVQAVPPIAPVGQQAQQANPLQEVGNHPVFQFYDQWKKSSPEMRKNAERKIAVDFPGGPRDMGLPDPTADVEGEALARKEGKDIKQDKGSWGKFMKFIDSNPKFLLDLGAQLLAPRKPGQSQMGAVASGLLGATNRLEARKAAAKKVGLETRKTEADISKVEAEVGRIPSEIEKNFSIAYKNYQDAKGKGKAAAGVQLLDTITESLWATGKDTKFTTKDEAKIAAQRMITGKASPEEKAYYDFMIENAILDVTPGEAKEMLAGAPSEVNIRAQEEGKQRRQQARETLLADPVKLEAFVRKNNPNMNDAQVTARMSLLKGQKTVAPVATTSRKSFKEALAARQVKPTAKKTAKTATRKLSQWKAMTEPGAQGMIDMTAGKAKEIRAEIERDYDSYSDKEQKKALDLINILDTKFIK